MEQGNRRIDQISLRINLQMKKGEAEHFAFQFSDARKNYFGCCPCGCCCGADCCGVCCAGACCCDGGACCCCCDGIGESGACSAFRRMMLSSVASDGRKNTFSAMQTIVKTTARIHVERERKSAALRTPNIVPTPPAPPNAPESPLPLLDCMRTTIVRRTLIRIRMIINTVNIIAFSFYS